MNTHSASTAMTGSPSTAARLGGLSYIVASVGFLIVFSWLASAFGYPDVLDEAAADVLPALLALGTTGRLVWIVYAVLPLLLIPAAVGASERFRDADGRTPASVRLAVTLQAVAAVAMTLGLARWSTANWIVAESWQTADASQRAMLATMFDAYNAFLGNAIGEFVGELALYGSFLAFGAALRASGATWIAALAGATGVAGLLGSFRNMTTVVQIASDATNLLLPLFLIAFGVVLMRARREVPR